MERRSLGAKLRFEILERDNFECQFCGSRPGNDKLHVDHFLPYSRGGSHDLENLGAACDKCNNGKSDRTLVPRKLLLVAEPDSEGYVVWKRFGPWELQVCDEGMIIVTRSTYWIGIERVHEDWEQHVNSKTWATDEVMDGLCDALRFARRIYRKDGEL